MKSLLRKAAAFFAFVIIAKLLSLALFPIFAVIGEIIGGMFDSADALAISLMISAASSAIISILVSYKLTRKMFSYIYPLSV